MKSKKVENFDKNIELLDYFTSTKCIKDMLTPAYGEIDEDVVDVVFYSILHEFGTFERFTNVTRSTMFSDLIKEFSKTKIIPFYYDRFIDEYIGYHVLDKRFVRVMFKKPRQEEFSMVTLFEKQAYLVREKSSKFEYYCNLHLIKEEYESLINIVKDFIKLDKKFVKFLKNTKYKENAPKRKFLSAFFAIIKELILFNRIIPFLKMPRENSAYIKEVEQMVSITIFEFLNALLRIN